MTGAAAHVVVIVQVVCVAAVESHAMAEATGHIIVGEGAVVDLEEIESDLIDRGNNDRADVVHG